MTRTQTSATINDLNANARRPIKKALAALLGTLSVLALTVAPLLPARADAVGGPQGATDTVLAGHRDVYHIDFYGGEQARVAAVGDGDIDILVYDENGNLVASDTASDDEPLVAWTPRWTGTFTVKIVNCKGYDIDYAMRTN